ncbi:MAG: DUF2092 domain-containing protein [Kiritimatiellae bacterium]|nr:DUF2092 domain-containing protein [Kiritimatiellia bacterium]MCO5067227.1 DUF2092 domain-containing protein [Kiritimatiellia bacterium]
MKHFLACALSFVVLTAVCFAEEPAEPTARQVLRRVCDFFQKAESFSADIAASTAIRQEGMSQIFEANSTLAVARPNRISLRFTGGFKASGMECISDGTNLWLYLPALGKYTQSRAPGLLQEVVESPNESAMFMGRGLPVVGSLIAGDPYEQMMEGVTEVTHLGREAVDGAECHHLRFTQEQFDWELWVDAGETPIVRKLVMDMSKAYRDTGKDRMMKTTYSYTNWSVGQPIPDDVFRFDPPADAKKVVSFMQEDDEGPHPLVGQKAPDFPMKLLEGGAASLVDHAGRIVVLDFWATWCPPCRKALPIVAKVAESFRTNGVAFYAVNLGDPTDKIRKFLDAQKITCPVVVDEERKSGTLYEAEAIPQTVLIDRAGIVQVVHRGFSPTLERDLRADIEALLAGRDLASATLSNAATRTESPRRGRLFEGKPLPAGTNAVTRFDVARMVNASNQRLVVDVYKRLGIRDPAWDAEALKRLEDYAAMAAEVPGAPSEIEMRNALARLADNGCQDPLILYFHGVQLRRMKNWGSAEPYLRRASDGFQRTNYPAFRSFMCSARLTQVYNALPNSYSQYKKWGERMMTYLAAAAADDSFLPGEQRLFFDSIEEQVTAFNVFSYTNLYERLLATPGANPWIVKTTEGRAEIRKAWRDRGSGFASTVSEEGWVGFKEHLELAKKALTEAWEMNPKEPHAAAGMIEVSMGLQDGEEMRLWFDRAVEAQFDYIPAYGHLLWAMRPRWFGSHREMLAFGTECMETKRYDTAVPWVFFTAVRDIGKELDDWKEAFRKKDTYRRLCELYEGYIRETNRICTLSFYQSHYAVTAWAAGEFVKAREMLQAVGGELDPAVTENLDFDPQVMKGEVALATGPDGETAQAALEARARGDDKEALRLFEKLATPANLNEDARFALDDHLFVLRAKDKLENGDWVDLMPSAGFAGWRKKDGDWSVMGTNTVRGRTDSKGTCNMVCQAGIGSNFEVKATIRFVTDNRSQNQACITIGKPANHYRFAGLRLYKSGDKVKAELDQISGGKKDALPIEKADSYKVHIQVWEGRATVYVNGKAIYANENPATEPTSDWDGAIGLYAYLRRLPDMISDYSKLQVRRLTAKPIGFDDGTFRE